MAFPTGYTKYQEVTIDSSKVSADLTDFPILIDLSDLVKTGSDIFDTCRSDGGDIRVTKSDGTTQLAREIVSIDTSSKTGEMWVKFSGTLSGSSDTKIRIYYNGTDTEPASDATYGSENVWKSAYKGVWHMGESSGGANDSTANGNNLTDNNTVGSGAGKIGGARDFELSNSEYFSITDANQTGLDFTGDLIFKAKIKLEQLPSTAGSTFTILAKDDVTNRAYLLQIGSNDDKLDILWWSGGDGTSNLNRWTMDEAFDSNDVGEWIHIAVSLDVSTETAVFYKGDDSTAPTVKTGTHDKDNNGTSIDDESSPFTIGGRGDGDNYFDGLIDEVRVANEIQSSDWIATEYNNENSPSTFYSTSDEQGGSTNASVTASVQTLTFSIQSPTITEGSGVSVDVITEQATADSYGESNYSADNSLDDLDNGFGQSFESNVTQKINSCKFNLKKIGSPTGNAVAKLYAHTGTFGASSKPTGTPLATSNNFDVSTLTSSMQLITFEFPESQRYEMQENTYYVISIEYSDGDVSNKVHVGIDYTSPTHSGNESYYRNSVWTESSSYDLIFYVYGEEQTTFSLTFSVQDPTIIVTGGNASVSPTVQSLAFSVQNPSITTIKNIEISLSTLTLTFSAPEASVTGGQNVSVSADAQLLSFSISDPVILTQDSVLITATVQALAFVIQDPSISTVKNLSVSADPVSLSFSVQSPEIEITGATIVNVSVQSLTFSTLEVSVLAVKNISITATAQSIVFALNNPSVSAAVNITASATVQELSFTIPDVTIKLPISVPVFELSFSTLNPLITAIRNVNIALSSSGLTFTIPTHLIYVGTGIWLKDGSPTGMGDWEKEGAVTSDWSKESDVTTIWNKE